MRSAMAVMKNGPSVRVYKSKGGSILNVFNIKIINFGEHSQNQMLFCLICDAFKRPTSAALELEGLFLCELIYVWK